jgi:colanic acid/amylovoran biosynthesis protein
MELGLHRALKAMIPDSEITILTPYPEIDRNVYDGCRLCESGRRRPVKALNLLIRAALWSALKRCFGTDAQFLLNSPELQEYQKADVLVDLSGDTLTEDYGIKCFLSHLVPIVAALSLGRPVVLCAQTIGPFNLALPLAKWAFNRVDLITAREELTLNYLRSIKIAKPTLRLAADAAFLLDPADPERVNDILADEGIDVASGPLVGITVSRWLGHRSNPENSNRLEALMADLADHLIQRLGVTVVLVSHVLGPGDDRDDRVMARSVLQKIQCKQRARLIAGDYRPEELKGLIGRCELFLGLRMHANIAALSMGVPTIAIAYSRKTLGIMKALGQERWVCDIGTLNLEELTARMGALWRQREKVRDDLLARMAAIKELALENAMLVKGLIETSRADRSA